MANAASQLVQHETATNLEMAYGGHSQNNDSGKFAFYNSVPKMVPSVIVLLFRTL